ncbi:hypothetical protein EHE19_006975 [Ruminiclostridium herbifermentans]|uniref:Adhesin domain-containing protein n=1 Tax=Ruminiclostridium herbifermentans TaxID=2488810 RepID=A0A4U7JM35_9FIRM|nr:DUF4097 family beta strand repeat-containing protein [Ruminiclostridium herbifermentans]QNU68162.1 hypothetical protein EHE19_006975 [Ruminiclostridium herbifermentans]
MRKLYRSILAITLLLAMLSLTAGCGVRINGREYEFFSAGGKDKSNLISEIGSQASDEFAASVDRENAEKIVLHNDAGNIIVKKSEDSQIKIEADKKARGASQNDKNTVLENMNIVIERDGNVIKIVAETNNKKDFWDWLKDEYKAFQATIDYTISLPEGIKAVDISTGAGNVEVDDLSTELKLNTGAGNIDIDEVISLGKNEISTGAGNIRFDGNIYDIESFKVSTGAGNIQFKVPEDTRMSLKANTGIGVLSGSFIKKNSNIKLSFDEDINGGGPKVELKSGVGNVEVDER